MDFGTGFKIAIFLLWPFLLLFLYYLIDKKGFIHRMEKFRNNLKK